MKFIADAPLGKLVKWLRILGYDTLYFRERGPRRMLERAEKEDRIILTRNHCLKRLSEGKKSLFITNDQPWNQLREVMRAYHIKKSEEAFSRCILCNHPLQRIVKSEVEDKVPEYVYNTQKNFFTCPQCYRIFWPGTHHRRMEEKIDTL